MIGIRIAKDGNTVDDGSDKQYVDTDTPLFKLFKTDNGSKVYTGQTFSPGSPDVIAIPHDLGYIPMFLVYMDRADNALRKLVLNEDSSFAGSTILVTAGQADGKNIYLQVSGTSITGVFGYNYFIFYDRVG